MKDSELIALIEQGFSAAQIAEALNYDIDAVELVISNYNKKNKEQSVEDLINTYRPKMLKVLVDIAESGENESARVAAARVIVEGKGILPDLNVDQWSSKFEKIKAITEKGRAKVRNRVNSSDNSDSCLTGTGVGGISTVAA